MLPEQPVQVAALVEQVAQGLEQPSRRLMWDLAVGSLLVQALDDEAYDPLGQVA